MDHLEKYIRENREQLDQVEQPEADLIWLGIQGQMATEEKQQHTGGKVIQLPQSWAIGIAASMLLLIVSGIWYISSLPKENQKIDLATYVPELDLQQESYQQLIAQKEADLNLTSLDRAEFEEIFMELSTLEEIHQEFLKDLPQFNQNSQLVEVIIKYYERKIRILERLSNEIEKRNYHEKNTLEKSI